MTKLNATQADITAAQGYWGNDNPPLELRQAFAAHRIASQAELVEALELADAALRGANMNMNVVERKVAAALRAKETTDADR